MQEKYQELLDEIQIGYTITLKNEVFKISGQKLCLMYVDGNVIKTYFGITWADNVLSVKDSKNEFVRIYRNLIRTEILFNLSSKNEEIRKNDLTSKIDIYKDGEIHSSQG
jgi:hypothetical protein